MPPINPLLVFQNTEKIEGSYDTDFHPKGHKNPRSYICDSALRRTSSLLWTLPVALALVLHRAYRLYQTQSTTLVSPGVIDKP